MEDREYFSILDGLKGDLRDRWDRLGYMERGDGSFATGHQPFKAPLAYLCRFYAPPKPEARFDDDGGLIKGVSALPPHTDGWEEMAKDLEEQKERERSLLGRLKKTFRKGGN